MAVTADSVVVELLAKVDDYQAKMTTAASTGERAFSTIEKSASSAEASIRGSLKKVSESAGSAGASQLILQSIVRRTTDQFAAGAPISTIFAEHISGLAEAGALAGGKLGALGELLSGPWGIAFSAAISVASILGSKLLENADAADAHKKAAKSLIDTIHDLDVALGKAVQTSDQARAASLNEANADLAAARAKRIKLGAILAEQLALANAPVPQGPRGEGPNAGASLVQDLARNKASDIQAQIAANDAAIATAEHAVVLARIPILQQRIKEATDATAAANGRLERATGRLNEKLLKDHDYAAYDRDLAAATRARDGEIAAIEQRRSAAKRAATEDETEAKHRDKLIDDFVQRVRNIGTEVAAATKSVSAAVSRDLADSLNDSLKAIEQADEARQRAVLDAGEVARSKPGAKYLHSLNLSPEEKKDQFDEKTVGYLQSFNSELDNSVTKALHLHGILGDIVHDLIDMAIKQALIKPIANSLFGGSGGGGLLSSLFSLGGAAASSGGGGSGVGGSFSLGHGGRASGGYVAAGQLVRVNEGSSPNNVEGWRPQGSGEVIPLGRMKAAQAGGSGVSRSVVDHRITIEPSQMFDAHVATSVVGGIAQMAPVIVEAAKSQTLAAARRPSLPRSGG